MKEAKQRDPEVQLMINKAVAFSEFPMFINNINELIVVPKINAYFSLNNVNSELDFKCKIVERLIFWTASNHWYRYWSSKLVCFINYMLNTNFTKKDCDLIYSKLGNEINHNLAVQFVESGYDLSLLKDDTTHYTLKCNDMIYS